MTKLLEEAIAKVRALPHADQDAAAADLIQYVDEVTTLRDRVAVTEGREAYARGEFISLDEWRHDMGFGDH